MVRLLRTLAVSATGLCMASSFRPSENPANDASANDGEWRCLGKLDDGRRCRWAWLKAQPCCYWPRRLTMPRPASGVTSSAAVNLKRRLIVTTVTYWIIKAAFCWRHSLRHVWRQCVISRSSNSSCYCCCCNNLWRHPVVNVVINCPSARQVFTYFKTLTFFLMFQ